MKESKIFTGAELEAMRRRDGGDLADDDGMFHGRAKPKIRELLNEWFARKQYLLELIKSHKRKKQVGGRHG